MDNEIKSELLAAYGAKNLSQYISLRNKSLINELDDVKNALSKLNEDKRQSILNKHGVEELDPNLSRFKNIRDDYFKARFLEANDLSPFDKPDRIIPPELLEALRQERFCRQLISTAQEHVDEYLMQAELQRTLQNWLSALPTEPNLVVLIFRGILEAGMESVTQRISELLNLIRDILVVAFDNDCDIPIELMGFLVQARKK